MAHSSAGGSLAQVRDSVKRLRGEGERFMGQIRRESQTFARRTRAELEADVSKLRAQLQSRAERSVKDLEVRGRTIVEALEKRIVRMADVGRTVKAAGGLDGLPKLAKRIGDLEQRIEQLEHELRDTLEDRGA